MLFRSSTNFRTPSEQTLFSGWFDGFQYFYPNPNLKPEYSVSEDVGYRYQGEWLTGSITFFNYNFTNRQISTQSALNSSANESINAGNQTTRGIDIEGGMRPWHHISPYFSAEYLHSVEDSNLFAGTLGGGALGTPGNTAVYLPTAGKTSIRSPEVQAALGLSYDDGNFFGTFSVKYVDSQYGTFMNDEGIPSYITTNLAVGARLPSDGLRARPEVKLNLMNLGGASYLSAVANPGETAGSSSYYLAGGFAMMFTATQAF